MYLDASFNGGSNDTIGGRRYRRFLTAAALSRRNDVTKFL
jgi:hypothetical protein